MQARPPLSPTQVGSPYLLHPPPSWSDAGRPPSPGPLFAPYSQDPLAEAGAHGGLLLGARSGSQPPQAQLRPLWKSPPKRTAADLSLPYRPRAVLGLGAREGASGAGPDYLQEESFGFGSPLLGPIQLTLPLPAAEKRQRLKRAPSRAPLRAALPSSPVPLRGAPVEPRPRRPCQLLKLTSARRLQ